MTLDDFLEIWRSQDSSPLHGVNETLLRLALRQDDSKLQTGRRLERWSVYLISAFLAALMAFILYIMIDPNDDDVLTGLDFAIPIIGTAAILLWPYMMHASYRAQTKREQCFGESLRDQLNRHIAQLDYEVKRVDSPAYHLVNNLPPMVWAIAFFFALLRINDKPLSDAWNDARTLNVGMVSMSICAIAVAASIWAQSFMVKRRILPHKRRLEELLKEIDG